MSFQDFLIGIEVCEKLWSDYFPTVDYSLPLLDDAEGTGDFKIFLGTELGVSDGVERHVWNQGCADSVSDIGSYACGFGGCCGV